MSVNFVLPCPLFGIALSILAHLGHDLDDNLHPLTTPLLLATLFIASSEIDWYLRRLLSRYSSEQLD